MGVWKNFILKVYMEWRHEAQATCRQRSYKSAVKFIFPKSLKCLYQAMLLQLIVSGIFYFFSKVKAITLDVTSYTRSHSLIKMGVQPPKTSYICIITLFFYYNVYKMDRCVITKRNCMVSCAP